jgi:hypothetical protein
MKKILTYAGITVVIFAVGIIAGWWGTKKNIAEPEVTSQVILSALRDRGFLVTQTNVFNEAITITSDSESFWRKLLWGQAIKAYGIVEVNLGVDLAEISESDVQIGQTTVRVAIPSARVFNTRLVGDISLENKQGILKRIFENDDGYNSAMLTMIKRAEASAAEPENMATANAKAQEEIRRLVGYVAKDKNVDVVIKEQ